MTSPVPVDVRELIAEEFARFLREEGARDRPWDFADGLVALVAPVIRRRAGCDIATLVDYAAHHWHELPATDFRSGMFAACRIAQDFAEGRPGDPDLAGVIEGKVAEARKQIAGWINDDITDGVYDDLSGTEAARSIAIAVRIAAEEEA